MFCRQLCTVQGIEPYTTDERPHWRHGSPTLPKSRSLCTWVAGIANNNDYTLHGVSFARENGT